MTLIPTKSFIPEGQEQITAEHIEKIFNLMREDYKNWRTPTDDPIMLEIRQKQYEKFSAGLRYEVLDKFIRLIGDYKSPNQRVLGFIVNVTNFSSRTKQFRYGAVLKASSYTTPAKNFERFYIFNLDNAAIRWTGIQ